MNFNEKAHQYFELLAKNKPDAMEYYYNNLLDEICEKFTRKVDAAIEKGNLKKYKYLIMTVGFSPEPMILWIRAVKPELVYFISSSNTQKFIDEISDKAGLRPTQIKYDNVDSSNTIEVYEKIKRFIDDNKVSFDEVAIDITGGKKSMVAGCTLAANYLGIDTLYVDYTGYNSDFRKPQPGSEIPIKLDDPLEVFGDRELQSGLTEFNSEDFINAGEVFAKIKDRVRTNPRVYEMYEFLALGYKELENMNFNKAYQYIDKAVFYGEMLNEDSFPLEALQMQLKVIKPLVDFPSQESKKVLNDMKSFWHIYGFLMSLADHYISQGKADLAALLTYRCLEMTIQYSLFKYRINVNDANFNHLDGEELLNKVNEIGSSLYGSTFVPYGAFPKKIGLMVGLMILKALEDSLVQKLDLSQILQRTEARNKSRYAHGFTTLTIDEVKPFYFTVLNNISEVLWSKERGELGYTEKNYRFKQFVDMFKFVKLS